jgi:hypothetical protein
MSALQHHVLLSFMHPVHSFAGSVLSAQGLDPGLLPFPAYVKDKDSTLFQCWKLENLTTAAGLVANLSSYA